MPQQESFESVWQKLKSLLQDLSPNLVVKVDEPGNYYLDTPYSEKWKKEVFFGAAQIKKNYVSFHLMPYICILTCLADSRLTSRSGCRVNPASTSNRLMTRLWLNSSSLFTVPWSGSDMKSYYKAY